MNGHGWRLVGGRLVQERGGRGRERQLHEPSGPRFSSGDTPTRGVTRVRASSRPGLQRRSGLGGPGAAVPTGGQRQRSTSRRDVHRTGGGSGCVDRGAAREPVRGPAGEAYSHGA
eukprot:1472534-Prymnesium_polylepis.1